MESCFRSRATQLRQPPVGPSIHPSICQPIIQQSVRLSRLLILGNLQVAAPVKNLIGLPYKQLCIPARN